MLPLCAELGWAEHASLSEALSRSQNVGTAGPSETKTPPRWVSAGCWGRVADAAGILLESVLLDSSGRKFRGCLSPGTELDSEGSISVVGSKAAAGRHAATGIKCGQVIQSASIGLVAQGNVSLSSRASFPMSLAFASAFCQGWGSDPPLWGCQLLLPTGLSHPSYLPEGMKAKTKPA